MFKFKKNISENKKEIKLFKKLGALAIIWLICGFEGVIIFTKEIKASGFSETLKGKILLEVEKNGEAWYVNPANYKRYFMGRPKDAFELMRELGVGITNKDLEKIKIAELNMSTCCDEDGDGLSAYFESAIGTSDKLKDSDNDGYEDKIEVLRNYNPVGYGKLKIDINFSKKTSG